MKHLFLSNPCLLDHGSAEHPENARRLQAILSALKESPYQQFVDLSAKRLATSHELEQVHAPAYVLQVLALAGKVACLDYETLLTPGSVNAALLAAGIGLELVEKTLDGELQNGFALVRPPGHHARPVAGMGFCIFDNIAVAAKKALSMGIRRILIFDWDVHHGNGTQEIFYGDERVLFIDIHQENLFPANSGQLTEIGTGEGLGFTVNIPLPRSCRDADYLYAFDKLVRPMAVQYRPELILVSAGFDAHENDPLGGMYLTSHGFGLLAARVKSLAHELCGGKLVMFLEGGYNPHDLAVNVMECLHVLADETPPGKEKAEIEPEVQPYSQGVELRIKEIQGFHAKQNAHLIT
jgi:acetoin utilization deacetylase AcuC-like enzyme